VYPIVVGGRVGLSGGGQVGGSSEGAAEVVSVSVWSEQRLARQAGRQGRAVVNDRLRAAAVAAV